MWKEYPNSQQMYEEAKKIFAMGVGSQVQSFGQAPPAVHDSREGQQAV